MFIKGDKFIHFTKHGGVNTGEVDHMHVQTVTDADQGFVYEKISIRSTRGVSYDLDGSDGKIYKIKRTLTKEECEKIKERIEKFKFHKQTKRAEILMKYGKDIDIVG